MIYLARHGQTEYNEAGLLNGQFDDSLTKKGEEQAVMLAEKCRELGINTIFSSQLVRAFVTARIVADILGIKHIISFKNLNERGFGCLTHQPVSKIPELSPDTLRVNKKSIYFLSGDGVETFPELIERIRPVYNEIRWYPTLGDTALVISYGDVMKAFEAIHRKVDFKTVLLEGHYSNCEIVKLARKSE